MTAYLDKWPEIACISKSEWKSYFPNQGKQLTKEERDYLIEWWDREDVIHFSFALGRPPYTIQRYATDLRKEGVNLSRKPTSGHIIREERQKDMVKFFLSERRTLREVAEQFQSTVPTVITVLKSQLGAEYHRHTRTNKKEAIELGKKRSREKRAKK